ncbi:MAG: LysM peptidoglycan-binding domain-containing protein, partial [Clostridia bacterium]
SLPNERKISTKTEVIFKVNAHKNLDVCVISNFLDDNIEIKKVNCDMNNIILEKTNIISSREDVILPKENEDMYEVLKVDSKILNTEFKESYNKIIIRGDILSDMVYISNNREVKKCLIEIPFTSMIELENINDRSKFDIDYVLTSFNIIPNTDIDTIKTMNCDYRIDTNITMYEEINIDYVDDFYSQRYDLDFVDERIDVVKNVTHFTKQIEINEKLNDVIDDNYKIIDIIADPSYIVLKEVDNKLHIEGNLKLSVLKQNMANMDIENKIMDILINEVIDIDNNSCIFNLVVDKVSFTHDNNELDVKVKMTVHAKCYNSGKIKSACDIESKNMDLNKLNSMNIYIVKKGDTLWSIAKKYKTSIDKIKSINNLEDANDISVNQKLLIIR